MKISHAHMHGTMHVPTLNVQLKHTLDQVNYPGIDMFRLENGDLAVKYNGVKFIIPHVNFKVCVIDQMAAKVSKKEKEKETNA